MKQLNFLKKLFMTLVIVLGFTCLVQARVIYVDCNATGSIDGTSWCTAYRTLQDALDEAVSGDEIRAADGAYKPSKRTDPNTARTETFQLKTGVAIYGGYAGCSALDAARNIKACETILSGDIGTINDNSDNCFHVVTGSGTNSTAVLDGFTVKLGNANITSSSYYYGGGIYSISGSFTISNCIFSGNSAQYGGGMFNNSSSPTISYCTFSSNTVTLYGGGMYNSSSTPKIRYCTFSDNNVPNGGGIYNDNSSNPTISYCTFSSNTVSSNGGGMYNNNSSSPTISYCTFSGNTANSNGGGIYNSGSSPSIISCTFSGNIASSYGGGMYTISSSPTLTNCTINGNTATTYGGGGFAQYGSGTMTCKNCIICGNMTNGNGGGFFGGSTIGYSSVFKNCLIYNNSAAKGAGFYTNKNLYIQNCTIYNNKADKFSSCGVGYGGAVYSSSINTSVNVCSSILWDNIATNGPEIYREAGTVSVTYSDVKGGWTGTGNINADPGFIDLYGEDNTACTTDDNFKLIAGSPCIDAGNNSCYSDFQIDLGGNPRFIDVGSINDTGSGTAPIVDMGAYEFQDYEAFSSLKYNGMGYFGIGTFPKASLHIGSDRGLTISDITDKVISWNAYYNNGWKYLGSDSAFQIASDYNADKLYFKTASSGSGNNTVNWTYGITLQSDGKVGIYTAAPKERLQIGDDKGATFYDGVGNKTLSWNAYYNSGWKYLGSDSAYQIDSDYSADKWIFKTAASGTANNAVNWINNLTLQSDGKVGIFTTTPKERLQIGGDKGATFHDGGDKALSWNAYFDNNSWKYLAGDSASQVYMDYINDKFYLNVAPIGQANGTVNWLTMLTLQPDGKLGIGTKYPKEMLQIGGGKGLTVHAGTDFALSWNAYYDSGWKYLDSDYAYQLYAGSTADRLTVRTAASGQKDGSITWIDCLTYMANGSVGIGTTDTQGYKLAVKDTIIAESIIVKPFSQWPDNVFESSYPLLPIADLEKYIRDKKSLPDIPTSDYIAEKGMNVGETQVKMLQKIEELTLYVIDLKKKNDSLEKKNEAMEKKNDDMEKRLTELEKGDKK